MNKILIFFALLAGRSIPALAQTGKITGKLTYPSEYIPTDMVMCVKSTALAGEPTYCSRDKSARLRDAKIAFKLNYRAASYEVSLPAGSYTLYVTTREMPGVKAYYDEYMKCGEGQGCKGKKPVPVKVKPGQITKGITVGDFW